MIYSAIGVILGLAVLFIITYLNHRQDEVYNFYKEIINLEYEVHKNNPGIRINFYRKLPSYNTVCFKFWMPLKLETFFTEKEIKLLKKKY